MGHGKALESCERYDESSPRCEMQDASNQRQRVRRRSQSGVASRPTSGGVGLTALCARGGYGTERRARARNHFRVALLFSHLPPETIGASGVRDGGQNPSRICFLSYGGVDWRRVSFCEPPDIYKLIGPPILDGISNNMKCRLENWAANHVTQI